MATKKSLEIWYQTPTRNTVKTKTKILWFWFIFCSQTLVKKNKIGMRKDLAFHIKKCVFFRHFIIKVYSRKIWHYFARKKSFWQLFFSMVNFQENEFKLMLMEDYRPAPLFCVTFFRILWYFWHEKWLAVWTQQKIYANKLTKTNNLSSKITRHQFSFIA